MLCGSRRLSSPLHIANSFFRAKLLTTRPHAHTLATIEFCMQEIYFAITKALQRRNVPLYKLNCQHLLTLFSRRVNAVMRGGAISFSVHRRCCIWLSLRLPSSSSFLLIHSDIFLCVQRSEYADFSGKALNNSSFL